MKTSCRSQHFKVIQQYYSQFIFISKFPETEHFLYLLFEIITLWISMRISLWISRSHWYRQLSYINIGQPKLIAGITVHDLASRRSNRFVNLKYLLSKQALGFKDDFLPFSFDQDPVKEKHNVVLYFLIPQSVRR